MHYSDRKKQPFRQVGTAAEKEGLRMAGKPKNKKESGWSGQKAF